MKKTPAFLLLFLGFSFAFFGNATIAVEKQWIVTGEPSEIKLTGLFLVNNSNQRVLEIDAEAPLEIKTEGDRLLAVYSGPFNNTAFRARALVVTNYDTKIMRNENQGDAGPGQDGITEYDESMAMLARELAGNQPPLETLVAISNWVSENMYYDSSYSGRFLPAKTVFLERRGVCAEYTHLFMALANSLGFKTRYVAGYAMADGEWQPHSWAEAYIDSQWVPFDPTFRQAGILDNSHIAVSYGRDADSIFDRIESYGTAGLETETNFTMIEDNTRKGDADINFAFFPEEKKGRTSIRNLRNDYLLGTYSRIVPEENGGEEKMVIAIKPYGIYEDEYLLGEDLQPGYSYSIPIILSFNDAEEIEKINLEMKNESAEEYVSPSTCFSAFVISAMIFLFKKPRDT